MVTTATLARLIGGANGWGAELNTVYITHAARNLGLTPAESYSTDASGVVWYDDDADAIAIAILS